MTTSIFPSITNAGILPTSYHHDQTKLQTTSQLLLDKRPSDSSNGFLRHLAVTNQNDLNDLKNQNEPQEQVNKISNSSSKVSVLAGKYLVLQTPTSSTPPSRSGLSAERSEFNCVNIQTKEKFICKIVPRNSKGLAILAAYHRLEDSSLFVNQVVEAILTPKILYLIMPNNYGNVHSYLLAKRNLKESEAANIFKQMAMALNHCHSKGVILRDVKMGRFVFADKAKSVIKLDSLEDAVLLVDPNDDQLDDKHGCPNYVSPEKAEILRSNTKYPGKATDVWSLGIILFTMLVGRYPFNDSDYSRLLSKIRTGTFTIPPSLSPSVTSLIKALLQKSPSQRPTCKEILKSSWIAHNCVPSSCSEFLSNEDAKVVPSLSSTASRNLHDQVVPDL